MIDRTVSLAEVPDPAVVRANERRVEEAPGRTAPWTGIAVDVLRATTTLTVAFGAGAARVVPFTTPAAAIAFRDREPMALACGERDGRIVPGFDLGNSPFEYEAVRVGGRTLAFASTNGSRAMVTLLDARRRLLGAFVNASAVVEACRDAAHVRIACAGKEGAPAAEDLACAGWIAARLAERGWMPADEITHAAIASAPRGANEVRERVTESEHGRYLASLGPEFARDVAFCAGLDTLDRCFEW